MGALLWQTHTREGECRPLATEAARVRSAKNMEAHLQVAVPDVAKIVTGAAIKLNGPTVRVWNNKPNRYNCYILNFAVRKDPILGSALICTQSSGLKTIVVLDGCFHCK